MLKATSATGSGGCKSADLADGEECSSDDDNQEPISMLCYLNFNKDATGAGRTFAIRGSCEPSFINCIASLDDLADILVGGAGDPKRRTLKVRCSCLNYGCENATTER